MRRCAAMFLPNAQLSDASEMIVGIKHLSERGLCSFSLHHRMWQGSADLHVKRSAMVVDRMNRSEGSTTEE